MVTTYVATQLGDRDAFADRAVAALDDAAVRTAISREVVVAIGERSETSLISARPLLQDVVSAVVGSEPFQGPMRAAARAAHALLFERGQTAFVFDLTDVSTVVLSALRSVAPEVAARVPERVDARLIDVRERPFAEETLRVADQVRRLAIAVPIAAVVLVLAALALAVDRRRAFGQIGLWAGGAAIVLAVALTTTRSLALGSLGSTEVLSAAEVRAAAEGAWEALLGDLGGLLIITAVMGFAGAAAALTLGDVPDPRALVVRLGRRPRSTWAALTRGLALIAGGVVAIVAPVLALTAAAYGAGALLVYVGTSELLAGLEGSRQRAVLAGSRIPRLALIPVMAAVAFGGATAAAALVLHRGDSKIAAKAPVSPQEGCNGLPSLCGKRINEVLFAGTHNSMSAADSPRWLLVNQRRTIARQLDDGIRLLLLDPHYGREAGDGRVSTDFAAEKRDANRVGRLLSPEAKASLARLGPSLGLGATRTGPRDVWLCHSVCELGATRMADALNDVGDFLREDPTAVIAMVIENYVTERDLMGAFVETGLTDEMVVLNRSAPLPTLGELIRARHRLVVFTEQPPSGKYPQLNGAFSFTQDTPLGAKKPGELRCARYRGTADSPILAVNHWIDRFPPPAADAHKILTEKFLRDRIARCEEERKLPVSFIATDFYDEGPFVSTIEELNAAR